MEIERKWMVNGWPEGLPLKEEFAMRQGYISVRPTVRIREEALTGGETHYVLCFKSGSGLAREEIERDIDPALFNDLETKIIGRPLIPKLRRSYLLPDGAVLEVNHVDEGQPTEFWYAEVEYPTVEAARSWQPAAVGLADYLSDEVTDQPAPAFRDKGPVSGRRLSGAVCPAAELEQVSAGGDLCGSPRRDASAGGVRRFSLSPGRAGG